MSEAPASPADRKAAQPVSAMGYARKVIAFAGAENLSLVIVLVILIAAIVSQTEYFLSPQNLLNLSLIHI